MVQNMKLMSLILIGFLSLSLCGCNLLIGMFDETQEEPIQPTPLPSGDPGTFSIYYYADEALTEPLGNHPYLGECTYYLNITSSETILSPPVINIHAYGDPNGSANGSVNDVVNGETTVLEGNSYIFTRIIVYDPGAVGRNAEDISINGVNPVNEDTEAAYIDTIPPEGSFLINEGAAETYNSCVLLTINAYDASLCGLEMMVSNYEDFSGAGWQAYKENLEWYLIDESGDHGVYMKFRDCAGNESGVVSNYIAYFMPG